jgi:hypothetical protein
MSQRFSSLIAAGLLAVPAAFLAGCGTTPEVTTWTNPVNGQRTDILAENLLDVPGDTREMLWLNAFREVMGPQRERYHLQVIYGAREEAGYLDINPGRSLTIIVDGEELHFAGLGTLDRDEKKGALFETARFDATADDIQRIASARKVTVRVTGKNGIVVREFAEENFEKFRQFAKQTGADL